MRPYPAYEDEDEDAYYWPSTAVTHVVYVLNDYSRYQLSRAWLPQGIRLPEKKPGSYAGAGRPETTGELLDSLKSFWF